MAEPHRQIRGAEVRAPLEHLQGLVTRDRCDLHHVKPLFEESARGLVSQVVETQAADACAAHRPPEGLFQSVWRELTEDAAAGRAG
jgi:hypothetical protein